MASRVRRKILCVCRTEMLVFEQLYAVARFGMWISRIGSSRFTQLGGPSNLHHFQLNEPDDINFGYMAR